MLIRSIAVLILAAITACSSAGAINAGKEQSRSESLKTEKFIYTIGVSDVLGVSVFMHDYLDEESATSDERFVPKC